MFINIYLCFIIQVKEDKRRIFSVTAGVRTDNRSGPGTADNAD